MFSEELQKYDWNTVTAEIACKTKADVMRALSARYPDIEDFKALISPAAEPFLEEMAAMSRSKTMRRFGKTISMYIPMYLTNACTNSCVYCGFNRHNQFPRVVLKPEEIESECKAVKELAPFENLLIVTGEHPKLAGVDYLSEAIALCRKHFQNISMEIMPLDEASYARLAKEGLNGVVCFQETYHRENYKIYHPAGMKSNFEWRVNGFDRMGAAGLHKIGLGILIGLEDWRTDITMLAIHLQYLKSKYWRTRYSVNFPRLRPSKSGFQPNSIMDDRRLAQAIFALRIFDEDVDISLSTREKPHFRDNMLSLGVSSMSAGSKTDPGGYATYPQALEQFEVSDDRTPREVAEAIRAKDYEPVWKDWDRALD